jgi:plastocyanin
MIESDVFVRLIRYCGLAVLAACPIFSTAATVSARVTDAAGKPLADAVVYAVPLSGAPSPKSVRGVTVEQIDREFTPYVTAIQVGTSVTFPNRDAMRHHVYSFSPAKTFEIKLYAGEITRDVLFDKPGVATLGCNIHDWMVGYIFVADTPFFAKSDNTGVAHLANLPAGQFELKVWHPNQRSAAQQQALKLEGDTKHEATFVVEAAPRKKKFKPPLDPISY